MAIKIKTNKTKARRAAKEKAEGDVFAGIFTKLANDGGFSAAWARRAPVEEANGFPVSKLGWRSRSKYIEALAKNGFIQVVGGPISNDWVPIDVLIEIDPKNPTRTPCSREMCVAVSDGYTDDDGNEFCGNCAPAMASMGHTITAPQ